MKKPLSFDEEIKRGARLVFVWAVVSIAIKTVILIGFIYSLYLAQAALMAYIEGGIQ